MRYASTSNFLSDELFNPQVDRVNRICYNMLVLMTKRFSQKER